MLVTVRIRQCTTDFADLIWDAVTVHPTGAKTKRTGRSMAFANREQKFAERERSGKNGSYPTSRTR